MEGLGTRDKKSVVFFHKGSCKQKALKKLAFEYERLT